MPRRLLLATAACVLSVGLSLAAVAAEQPIEFHGALDGAHEVPGTQSEGSGRIDGTLDRQNKVFTYTVTYKGLSGPVTAAHFHGPADPGANAGVVVPLQQPLTSPIKGKATLNDQQMDELMSNKLYVNLHTQKNPNGEIRGQVLRGSG
ncbi:MAG: CHRD domain-containing protein [Acetobacteraceae bacterium]|nr:CHRD domain-containing protein [Acetobacteraceae bacterium]MBV8522448.1 CHRD domain-containing protein [Acetobacteraceae bacterium]MBV8592195.1 CHRD domain-containing protein [Acetobacteraceae bacterium]